MLSSLESEYRLKKQSRIYANNLSTFTFKASISSPVVTFMMKKYENFFRKQNKKPCICILLIMHLSDSNLLLFFCCGEQTAD